MNNRTISQKILASFALVLAMMLFMGGFAYTRLSIIESHAASVEGNSLPGLYYSSQMLSIWSENYSIIQELGIQLDKATLASLVREVRDSRAKLDRASANYAMASLQAPDEDMNAHEIDEHQHFDAFKSALSPYTQIQEEILTIATDPKNSLSIQQRTREQLDPEFDKVRDRIQALVEDNRIEAQDAARLIAHSVTTTRIDILASIFVALAVAALCAFYLLRAVTRPLRSLLDVMEQMRQGNFTQRIDRRDEFGALGQAFNRMADELTMLFGQVQKSGIQVTTSVTAISATSREQQATANEIAATATEIGATSREISATSKELVRTMNEVSGVAEQAATLAGGGQIGLSRMEETMQHVTAAAASINTKLVILNEKASNINKVVTTITKVADQTNLLSLNAAIEAEKAGEYGRGFAVVASEIRRLADQTAVATYDIEQIVKEIQSALSAGVMSMDKFSEEVRRGVHDVQQVGIQLTQIIQQVQALTPRFDAVNDGMQAQATGAEQISHALTQLNEAARQTVESLRQSDQAIQELNEVSNGLRSGVSRFKLEA